MNIDIISPVLVFHVRYIHFLNYNIITSIFLLDFHHVSNHNTNFSSNTLKLQQKLLFLEDMNYYNECLN